MASIAPNRENVWLRINRGDGVAKRLTECLHSLLYIRQATWYVFCRYDKCLRQEYGASCGSAFDPMRTLILSTSQGAYCVATLGSALRTRRRILRPASGPLIMLLSMNDQESAIRYRFQCCSMHYSAGSFAPVFSCEASPSTVSIASHTVIRLAGRAPAVALCRPYIFQP